MQTTNMSSGRFALENLQRTTPEIEAAYPRSRLAGGEVILGIRASIGAAFVVPLHLRGANLSRGVARIETDGRLRSDFLVMLLSGAGVSEYWSASKQGSTFSEVSIETVKELSLPLPSLVEQSEIVCVCNKRLEALDLLAQQAERAIALLRERRAALIASAVTGKIDVRNYADISDAKAA